MDTDAGTGGSGRASAWLQSLQLWQPSDGGHLDDVGAIVLGRRIMAMTAAAVMALGGVSLALAPGAAAATYDIDACQSGSYTVVDGDTVNMFWIGQNDGRDTVCERYLPNDGVTVTDFSVVPDFCYQVLFSAGGEVTSESDTGMTISTDTVATLGAAVPAYGCRPPSVAADVDAPPPPDSLQQVGLPPSGSCDAINDKDLGFGTSLTGGWTKSNAEWANDARGGYVCSRTLHYSTPRQAWVLA
jgi:hypothetical protein